MTLVWIMTVSSSASQDRECDHDIISKCLTMVRAYRRGVKLMMTISDVHESRCAGTEEHSLFEYPMTVPEW